MVSNLEIEEATGSFRITGFITGSFRIDFGLPHCLLSSDEPVSLNFAMSEMMLCLEGLCCPKRIAKLLLTATGEQLSVK